MGEILRDLPARHEGPHAWLWQIIYVEAEKVIDLEDELTASLPDNDPRMVDRPVVLSREERVKQAALKIHDWSRPGMVRIDPYGEGCRVFWWNPEASSDKERFVPYSAGLMLAYIRLRDTADRIAPDFVETYTSDPYQHELGKVRVRAEEASEEAYTGKERLLR